jgi:adenylosuccinate lyase
MSDTLPTATRLADPGIRALYTLEARWQAWLDVEAALAKAQAELDIVPSEAAEAIARVARLELLDRARIDEGLARTGHTLVPLIWELARVVGDPHGGWVHWGATTQNITQTGDLLLLRQAHRILLRLIGEVLGAMAGLARRGADMVLAGRTHGQHAVPATFGYKVAVWIDELLRHVERFQQAAPRWGGCVFGVGGGGGGPPHVRVARQAGPARASRHRQTPEDGLDEGALTRPRRPSGRKHLPARHVGGDLRQDRPRDLHADED